MKITMKMQITIISLSVTMIHDVNINCIIVLIYSSK